MSKKQKIIAVVIGIFVVLYIIGSFSEDETNQNINDATQKIENQTTELATDSETQSQVEMESEIEKTTELATEILTELTEEEYKNLCQEVYNDDIFKSTINVGKYVKIHVMASSKYKYSSSNVQGIIVKDITEKYNLSMNCLGCTVMHESTKDSTVPSYFGEQMYIMFIDGNEMNLDTFETGQKYIIYGEVIQNVNGTFVLPQYYEGE